MKQFTTIALSLVAALACSAPTPPPETPSASEEESRNAIPEGPPEKCVDADGEAVVCEEDSECCQGFECGYDPEGSTRIKTCIWAGG